jgi:nicotinamide mononucleotide transporter
LTGTADALSWLLQTARPLLAPAFTAWGSPVTWLEVVASLLAVAMVLANLRVSAVGWPLAILSSALYALLFADSKLYGEAGLQFVFIALAGWGWWQWLRDRGESGGPLRVHRLSARGRWTALGLTLLAWPLVGALLHAGTDSDVPYLDALPTVASLTGQALLGRKLIENWPVWLFVNLISVGLFAFKGLWLTALVYSVFAILSLAGWRAWRQRAAVSAATSPSGG